MGKPTIADSGWIWFILDHYDAAMTAARNTATDLDAMRTCEVAGCERMFDGRDPRAVTRDENGAGVDACPGCEIEHDPVKARRALALALERNPKNDV